MQDLQPLIGVALRVTVMYLFALILTRLSGKRSLGSLSAVDFVVTVLIGDFFDDVFWAEVPLSEGLLAFGLLVTWHMLVAYGSYKSVRFGTLVGGARQNVLLVGKPLESGLAAERLREDDLEALLRLQTYDREDWHELKAAAIEPSGRLSALPREQFKAAQRQDLDALKEPSR